MIRLNKLNKYYNKGKSNEIHAINNTSLEFGDTGLICILGESGSGKTTLLNTIGGLDNFQSGSITVGETTFNKYSSKDTESLRNSRFGYIFQEKYLLQDYTVDYNIRLALNMYDISDEEKDARIDYVLEAVDMKRYKKRLVSQLSGGQQQRIAIARALVKTPDIIFADEPTGNLDEVNTIRVMSIIKKISKECLVILVTHERQIAEFFADRIIHIQDGKVVRDEGHEGSEAFRYSDDTNLYLKEFEREDYDNNGIAINFYHNGKKDKVTLNMVYANDKFYIQTPDESKVVFLTSSSEMQMVDDAKPVIHMDQVEDFDYSLTRLEVNKKPNLPFREVYQLAKENVRMLGKKQIFMFISFIITAILMVIAAADYMTASSIDKKSIITSDSHYISVKAKYDTSIQNDDYEEDFNHAIDSVLKSKAAKDIYIKINQGLSFTDNNFEQTEQLQYTLSDFSYVTLDHFNKKDLVYGRMPKNSNEIIIDQWLIDKFQQSDSILKELMPDTKDFLNLVVKTASLSQTLKIVGICDTNEPVIYIDKYTGLSIDMGDNSIASLQQLQKAYPGKYDDVKLTKNEVMVPKSVLKDSETWMNVVVKNSNNQYSYSDPDNHTYMVAGTYPDNFPATFVIDNKYYRNYINRRIENSGNLLIYTSESGKNQILKCLSSLKKNVKAGIILSVSDTYQNQLKEYNKTRAFNMNARLIVTVIIFAVSMLMLFFSMKSNAVKRVQEISVYRLLGITRKSILSSFILETVMVTSYTTLPAVLIISGIIKFIAGIKSLQLHIVYPWPAMLLLLVFMYAVNIIVSLIPVWQVIKLPPAQMAEKGMS